MKRNVALRTLEFLNLVEDDKPRLSWTRIGFVVMMGLAVYAVLKTVGAGEAGTVAGASLAALTALASAGNYIHQRMAWYSQPQEQRPIGFGRGHGEQPDDPDRD